MAALRQGRAGYLLPPPPLGGGVAVLAARAASLGCDVLLVCCPPVGVSLSKEGSKVSEGPGA